MANNTPDQEPLSRCHHAKIVVRGGAEGTNYYECTFCQMPCDVYLNPTESCSLKPSESTELKPTLHDVTIGTPAGQKAVQDALERSATKMDEVSEQAAVIRRRDALREELRQGSEARHYGYRLTPDGKEGVEMVPLEWAVEVIEAQATQIFSEVRETLYGKKPESKCVGVDCPGCDYGRRTAALDKLERKYNETNA